MNPGEKFNPSVTCRDDDPPVPIEALSRIRGYAVLVATVDGTYRRRVYLSIESAFRAVERAEARGVAAHAVLCELRALGGQA